jgi:hypothetical protein
LRGDRDWRRSPQLTGSRQVSQLATQAYKLLEAGDTTVTKLTHALGREVTEGAVLRAITELWQQLRIIPVVSAPGKAAQWQLLRQRFQKAIAEGASTSQVTAISVLASIYLQAVIAASMEEVELFLSSLTARSKVREVLRGLVATRQVHTISLGHAPHFYVAGTLPEFATAPSNYASASMPASAYFMVREEEHSEPSIAEPVAAEKPVAAAPPSKPAEPQTAPPAVAARKPVAGGKSVAARPHFSRPAAHSRDRKPAQSAGSSRPVRRAGADSRPSSARTTSGARPAAARFASKAAPSSNRNGAFSGKSSASSSRTSGSANGRTAERPSNGTSSARTTKSAAPAWGNRSGHSNGAKPVGKSSAAPRKDARPGSRPVRSGSSRKPALAAGAKAGNSKRFGFTARPKPETKKRG